MDFLERGLIMEKTMHILRYGTVAEKVHLERAISSYDCLSINANTAAYVSSAIARFIVERFFSNIEKSFFIDPITYAFQNKIELLWSTSKTTGEKSLKKSISKLLEIYDYPATKVKQNIPIYPYDFDNSQIKEAFCNNVLDFQYNLVYDHIRKNDLQKYLDYVQPNQSVNISQLRPKFLIAPYFYLDSNDFSWNDWLNLNIDFVKMAIDKSESRYHNCPVFAQIVISKSILKDNSALLSIANKYNSVNCTGYTIWVDGLSEQESSLEELSGFVKFLSLLNSKPKYNMYGGFFSIMLTSKTIKLLTGVSHGLEYGESREVYPVGGGIPVSKYYFSPLHNRLDFTKAFYLLEYKGIIDSSKEDWGDTHNYYDEICNCRLCKKLLRDRMIHFIEFESREFYEVKRKDQVLRRKKASPETKQNCLYHYLLCKQKEFSLVNKESINTILINILNEKNKYVDCEAIYEGELDYVDRWYEILLDFVRGQH